MRVEKTILEGCFIIHDKFFGDERGYFFESFNRKRFYEETGVDVDFVQDNQSSSQRGVLRGLHYQKDGAAQAKLVRVIKGKVLDVAVDLRKASITFGKHIAIELSEDSHTQLFVPRGFAHGFVVLSEEADFFYKCDNYYDITSEGGIMYNDKTLGIDWKIAQSELLLSGKDKLLPTFGEAIKTINF
jgi:dTDP-4-dehydrorhamnose 3,5-epimerase